MKQLTTLWLIGYAPVAPGTVASAVAILFAVLMYLIIPDFRVFLVMTCLVTATGFFSVHATIGSPDEDPPEVVIDELAGQWIALLPVSWCIGELNLSLAKALPYILVAFILFRVLDIFKPPPIAWADRLDGAVGIMTDDIFAGLGAAILLIIVILLIP